MGAFGHEAFVQLVGIDVALRGAQRVGLSLAASLGERLREVREQHREPQHRRYGEDESGMRIGDAEQRQREQAERQDERKDERSRHGTRMDQPLLLLVEALELELLLAGDALALINDDFTLLDMVVDGLHGLGHGIAEGLRGLAVQGERGHDQRREQDQHGAAALRGELFGGAQLLREGREHGFSASEARKASCASGEVSCPLINLSIPKIFCRNAAISVTLRSNTVGWSMAT